MLTIIDKLCERKRQEILSVCNNFILIGDYAFQKYCLNSVQYNTNLVLLAKDADIKLAIKALGIIALNVQAVNGGYTFNAMIEDVPVFQVTFLSDLALANRMSKVEDGILYSKVDCDAFIAKGYVLDKILLNTHLEAKVLFLSMLPYLGTNDFFIEINDNVYDYNAFNIMIKNSDTFSIIHQTWKVLDSATEIYNNKEIFDLIRATTVGLVAATYTMNKLNTLSLKENYQKSALALSNINESINIEALLAHPEDLPVSLDSFIEQLLGVQQHKPSRMSREENLRKFRAMLNETK